MSGEIFINQNGAAVGIEEFRIGDQGGEVEAYVNQNGEAVQFWPSGAIIDDFEHNALSTFYDWPSSSGTRDIVSRAARSGDYGLEIDGFGHVISAPDMGLENYPESGTPFELYFNPIELRDDTQFWFYFGATSTNEDDYYTIEVIYDSAGDCTFRVRSPSNAHVAADNNAPTWSEGTWHRILVNPYSDGGFRCRIYEDGSSSALSDISDSSGPTGTWGTGYRCSSNGRLYVDDVATDIDG